MSKEKKGVRFLLGDSDISQFVYRPPKNSSEARNATLGVKFAQRRLILDDHWLFGGTPWTRTKYRLKHPIIYSKRGLRSIYRRIKRIFVKDKVVQCLPWPRTWINKEEAKKLWPENTKKKNARHSSM